MTTTHLRTLFLHPKPTYAIGEAAALLEMDWRDLRGWMESGEVEGIETDEGLVLPWAELVSFGMEPGRRRWSRRPSARSWPRRCPSCFGGGWAQPSGVWGARPQPPEAPRRRSPVCANLLLHRVRVTLERIDESVHELVGLRPVRAGSGNGTRRVSRSSSVNADRARELQSMFNADFVVVLPDGTKVARSRRYRAAYDKLTR